MKWRGARAAESGSLLRSCALTGTVGSNPTLSELFYVPIAQWIEHWIADPRVGGSNPLGHADDFTGDAVHIDSYEFGRMSVNGRSYSSDLILYPDGSISDQWWRREGHLLQVDDLDRTEKVRPEIIVIGMGAYGMMRVGEETRAYLDSLCTEVVIEKTQYAVERFNELSRSHSVEGMFHLTC
jgi:hypothetical protein